MVFHYLHVVVLYYICSFFIETVFYEKNTAIVYPAFIFI
jgi:hypothetical protein